MEIVLVRHAYSTANKHDWYSGWIDVDLAEEGIASLKEYKKSHHYPKTDRYYSSDLKRAVQTFDILFSDEVKLDHTYPELREIYYGELEGKTGADSPINFNENFFLNNRVFEGEIVSEFSYRIYKKLIEILKDLREHNLNSATIVCHAGVIKMLVILLEKRPFSDFSKINAPNGLGYILNIALDDNDNIILNSRTDIQEKEAGF